jgi:hypothetical protein
MWTCPACKLPIEHRGYEDQPRAGLVYRCHVCRLELELDPQTGKLALSPLQAPEPPKKRRIV